MCLLAMKKLSVLICSLRPEDESDHGDGGRLPPLSSSSSSSSPARGDWPSRGPGSAAGAPMFSQQAADAALDWTLCPPNVPDARRPDTLPLE